MDSSRTIGSFPIARPRRPSSGANKRGAQLLFLPEDRAVAQNRSRLPEAGIPYWRHLKEHLLRRGMHLLVLLVPMQYTIYAPLTTDPPPPCPGPSYLARTADALRAADIDAVT